MERQENMQSLVRQEVAAFKTAAEYINGGIINSNESHKKGLLFKKNPPHHFLALLLELRGYSFVVIEMTAY